MVFLYVKLDSSIYPEWPFPLASVFYLPKQIVHGISVRMLLMIPKPHLNISSGINTVRALVNLQPASCNFLNV